MKVNKTRSGFGFSGSGESELRSLRQEVRRVLDKQVEKFPQILFHLFDMETDAGAKIRWERTAIKEETVS